MGRQVTFAEILGAVARRAGVTVASILGPAVAPSSRENWPRQRAVLLARRLRPDLSFPWLAGQMGGRDHGTVVACHKAGERRLARYTIEREAVAAVLADLGVDALPPYRPAHRTVPLAEQIATTQRRLADLQQRYAQEQEHA